jgi:hypothetical protein
MACTGLRGTLIVTPLAAGKGVSQATGAGDRVAGCDMSDGATIPIGDSVKVEVKPARVAPSDSSPQAPTPSTTPVTAVNGSGAGSTTVTIPRITPAP